MLHYCELKFKRKSTRQLLPNPSKLLSGQRLPGTWYIGGRGDQHIATSPVSVTVDLPSRRSRIDNEAQHAVQCLIFYWQTKWSAFENRCSDVHRYESLPFSAEPYCPGANLIYIVRKRRMLCGSADRGKMVALQDVAGRAHAHVIHDVPDR